LTIFLAFFRRIECLSQPSRDEPPEYNAGLFSIETVLNLEKLIFANQALVAGLLRHEIKLYFTDLAQGRLGMHDGQVGINPKVRVPTIQPQALVCYTPNSFA
jgi:hypothetical protein